jgi:hypothetical protein
MITFLAVLGALAFVGAAAAVVVYLIDLPSRQQRYRIENQVQDITFEVCERTREAFAQMLDAARGEREDQP